MINNQKGIAVFISLFIIFILLAAGATYLRVSSFSSNMIAQESDKIKARNLAQAGLEAAVIIIKQNYKNFNYSFKYPGTFSNDLLNGELKNGYYKILKIEPLKNINSSSSTILKVYDNIDYKDAFNIKTGKYTVYNIETEGVTLKKVKVKLKSLVKVIIKDSIH